MHNILSLPSEVISLTFFNLEPCALQPVSRVCKIWKLAIDQDSFLKTYAPSRSNDDMFSLTPEIFYKLMPYFNPQQVMQIDGQKIHRHVLHKIPESPRNKLNLRIGKLLASLEWYRGIVKANIESCVKQWHSEDEASANKFRESHEYIHLFVLGTSLRFMHNRAEKKAFAEDKTITLLTKQQAADLEWNECLVKIEAVIEFDYLSIKNIQPEILHSIFHSVFCRYEIKHLIHSRSLNFFVELPSVLFKALFEALTTKYKERSALDLMDIDQPPPVPNGGIDSLYICARLDGHLTSLGSWLKVTGVRIENLHLNIGCWYKKPLEEWQTFKDCIIHSKVKRIQFYGDPGNQEIQQIMQEISQLTHL